MLFGITISLYIVTVHEIEYMNKELQLINSQENIISKLKSKDMNTGRERMGDENKSSDNYFTSAMTLTCLGVANVPQRYVLPPAQRPDPSLKLHPSNNLPIIDLSGLHGPLRRAHTIEQVRSACTELGFFQVINHGIPISIINEALGAAREFFHLSPEEKMRLCSGDVREPVRYGTSLNHIKDRVYFWRDFIKHYSYPLSKWIDLWPSNPQSYKEKMGSYAEAVYKLQKQLMGVLLESLGLNPNYLQEDIEEGSQVIAVNCYPACPEPDLALGMPPHSDYGSITIINQSQQGLEIMDQDKRWCSVPVIEGALIVQLGDQMEIMSNGRYKSVIHRATVNSERKRLSIASLHSLALEKKVRPAPELVDEQHPICYDEGSFSDFLSYITANDIMDGRYIETLRKNP